MQKRQKNGLQWFEFELFQPHTHRIRHGCWTRLGGTSKGPYASLNVGSNVGDRTDDVMQNRARIADCFTSDLTHLFDVEQIHKTDCVLVKQDSTSSMRADILLSETPNHILMIKHADCQAALLYDPEHHVCAAVHAGWRGLVQKAYTKALYEMSRLWKTNPQHILVGISPSLGVCHSEFLSWKEEFPPEMWPFAREASHMDLNGIAKQEFLQAGVLAEHIEIANLCTYDTPELFFSYRRDKVTGRTATCIQLLPQSTEFSPKASLQHF